jgi:hypothetical protein
VNPLARFAFRWGVPDPGDVLLETVGRRSGRPQVTPVCDGLEADTFWLLSERVRAAPTGCKTSRPSVVCAVQLPNCV